MLAHNEHIKVHCKSYGKLKSNNLLNSNDFKPSDINLYKIYLPEYLSLKEELFKFLDAKEVNKANRYYNQKDRNRFIICRALLKFVLAKHGQSEVSKITLSYHDNNKPYLPSHPALFFNVTHSEDYALIAIANRSIGVDIEYITKNDDLINSVTHIFSEQEIAFIKNATNKNCAFYTLWTRKEAFVKALGTGIDDNFSKVPSLEGSHSTVLATNTKIKNWRTDGYFITKNYVAAITYDYTVLVNTNLIVGILPNNINNLMDL